MPKKNDVLDVTVDGLDDDGLATARVMFDARRLRFHVRDAVPGDHVSVRVEGRVRDEVMARVVSVLVPSPDRQAEPCVHRSRENGRAPCGGCSLQAMSYEAQLRHKAERVRRQLGSRGVAIEVLPTIAAPTTFRHRHKMELTFGRDRADKLSLGLHPSGYRWEVMSTPACRLISEWAGGFLPTILRIASEAGLDAFDHRVPDAPGRVLRNFVIREAHRTTDRMLELVTTPALDRIAGETFLRALADAAGAAVSGWIWTQVVAVRGTPTRQETIMTLGRPALEEVLHLPEGRTLALTIHPRAFFQPHPRAAERLVAEVVRRLKGDREKVKVLDLYCGTGTLALAVAPFAHSVVGVELVPEAVANAQGNARRAGFEHVTFIAGDVGAVLADLAYRSHFDSVDVLLLDPPRVGLAPQALTAVGLVCPATIIYVSCNPSSLARDLVALRGMGYTIDGPAQPVDLFPQTPHVETVVALSRGEPMSAISPAS